MESCQGVPEERLTLRPVGDNGFEGVVTKGVKTKQESSEENQSKDEKGPINPVNLSVGYMTGWGEKEEVRGYCWTLCYRMLKRLVHSQSWDTEPENLPSVLKFPHFHGQGI